MDDIAIRNGGDTTGPLDPRVLTELSEIQRKGRPGFMQRIITLYLQTAAELIKELEAASVSNEAAILYRASHYLEAVQRDGRCLVTCGSLRGIGECHPARLRSRRGSPR